jgi:hypothetical protein
MLFLHWVIGTLATWRMTHLLNSEDGPGELFLQARQKAGDGFWGRLLGCFLCLSLWVAFPLAWLSSRTWKERALLWPAFSAGAILIEHSLDRSTPPPPAVYYEDKEP